MTGNPNDLVGQVVPLVDAVKLEHRLTSIEASIHAVDASVARLDAKVEDGVSEITTRQDEANGRTNTLEAAERARAQRESNEKAFRDGATQLKLGVKGWILAGLAILGGIIAATGGVISILNNL